jgi:UDP-glucose 4-epimerase
LVRDLLADGDDVLVFDNFTTGRRALLPQTTTGLQIVEGDITSGNVLVRTLLDWQPDVVFHLAAIHFIPYCNTHPMETLRVNTEGTQAVLCACRRARAKRIILASSAAVYPIATSPQAETDPTGPCDFYGLSKRFAEDLVIRFHRDTGIPCGIARLFNIFGPRETNPHVIPHILEQVAVSDEIELGNVNTKRDFVHVADVSAALRAMANWEGLGETIFNVGTGNAYSIREVVETCARIVGRSLHIDVQDHLLRKTDRPNLTGDITSISRDLGWRPNYDLEAGLRALLSGDGTTGDVA